ncbi:hypothetical protein DB313_05020 (plasmid) [Borrelia turcica IST7]|uniref:Fibronectin-binding protein n=1 Tax=Borrelia turcica IST7 TaxID=1104446 RepID=A0A386PMS5_9SPIR|nr:hypothetical protein [Borrelia turcica]AYE36861.1 hypothetical protein DB313_05020 [Borrelia turcica IST7]
MGIKRKYVCASILLSFVSCDLSVLDKTKDVLSEVRGILESDAVKDVASGKAGFTVVSETKTSVTSLVPEGTEDVVGVSMPPVETGKKDNTVGTTNSIATGDFTEQNATTTSVASSVSGVAVSDVVGGSTYETGLSGYSSAVDITENSSSSFTSGSYSGEMITVEEYDSYGFGMTGSYGLMSNSMTEVEDEFDGDDDDTDRKEKRDSNIYDFYLKKTKGNVYNSLGLVKKIIGDYDSVNLYTTKYYSPLNLGETSEKANDKKELDKYTKEQLEKDLNELLGYLKEGQSSLESAKGVYKSDISAKNKLSELQTEVEKFIAEVETDGSAYDRTGTRQGQLSKMIGTLNTVKDLLNSGSNIGN